MIDYPNELNIIFDKLDLFNIKAIIVGGYVRDKLLKLNSKDIDIELYGIDSLELLEDVLSEFGSLNTVGKSFGVCKLNYKEFDIDFSLPRRDSKIDSGHRGFLITTDKNLDFKTAASRRDFTINAIGFDVKNKVLLDPHNGQNDLKTKILRAVDIEKFGEDPLRVLRGIQFSSRFNLQFDFELFMRCKSMINSGILYELPAERIFEELKKMLLKSNKPSHGLLLLKELDTFSYFHELNLLDNEVFQKTIKSIDFLNSLKKEDEKTTLTLILALLCKEFSEEKIDSFLNRLTRETKLHKDVKKLLLLSKEFQMKECSNYKIYSLAQEIEVKSFLLFLHASYLGEKEKEINYCKSKAKSLNIYTQAMPAFLQGKDLISLGLKPSKKFTDILDKAYDAQKKELFRTKQEAILWIKKDLLP